MKLLKNWKFRQECIYFSVSILWQQVFRVFEQNWGVLNEKFRPFRVRKYYLCPFPCQKCEKSYFCVMIDVSALNTGLFMSESTYLKPFPCQMSECRKINHSAKTNCSHSFGMHGKGRKYVLSDMKRPMFYVETSIITQKQAVLTHLAWERPQICTFWHEKAGVLCRNINHSTKKLYSLCTTAYAFAR